MRAGNCASRPRMQGVAHFGRDGARPPSGWSRARPGASAGKSDRRSAGDEVRDERENCSDQEQVDQGAPDMKSESQEPQDEQHCKDRPQHKRYLSGTVVARSIAPGGELPSG